MNLLNKLVDQYATTVAMVVCAAFVGYACGCNTDHVVITHQWESVEQMARAQPLALQANLLVVAGVHAAGKDMELLEILGPYAIKMRDQLIEREKGKVGKREWVRQ